MAPQTQATSSSSHSKPSSPPPPYSEFVEPSQQSARSPQSHNTMNSPSPAPVPSHVGYGPTPIPQQTHLLPYYDPRSPHAVQEATRRARRRFIEAFLCAIGILALISLLTGVEAHMNLHAVRIGGWVRGALGECRDCAQW
ncbi:uncharacterized protein LAESUDRAFT_653366 [Laetiporus sulphureus 93-53]|uniref:Uncharacterized protein n=1 Tax=Laetiporus sulphureus 93-53 TaxID=1314785 RepID=A0A165E9D5_9APHY|nr:uncharacterized protein LAESUDRAFT_653366 [Laetiporus sulphureus 93-53]KZT06521.1 hypothetical protein LAESUDRAFT_653366 [Laetiporus sulphureus 93-53]